MNTVLSISAADQRDAGLFALARIEHLRAVGKCGPQGFPAYDRKETFLKAGYCTIIIETDGDDTTVSVYPPQVGGLKHGTIINMDAILKHPGILPPTLLGKQSEAA